MTEGDSLEMTQEEINPHIVGVAMLQQFSTSELTQMHGMHTYEPIDPTSAKVRSA